MRLICFYLLVALNAAPTWAENQIVLEPNKRGVSVRIGDSLFAEYLTRSGKQPVIWPIIGPTGESYTRAFPVGTPERSEAKDHPHHRSMWFAHGNVNGFDFWNNEHKNNTCEIVHREFVKFESDRQTATIVTRNDWIASGKKQCEDQRTIVFGADGSSRWIDFSIRLIASAGDVTFGDTKEGTFATRVAGTMKVDPPGQGHIVNSRGQQDKAAWGQPAEWVDYFGPVKGETVGIAILSHPSNFRHPCRWHVRSYGLFAANPFGESLFPAAKIRQGEFLLPAGEELTLRYRAVFHQGDSKAAKIRETYQAFSQNVALQQANDYDLVVIGGTPAGIAAAIAAGRAGKSVILIEQSPVLGGVLSSGVLRLDDRYVESNSGVMEEFRQRVSAYHRADLAEDPLVKSHMKQIPSQRWNIADGRAWEPHTAARIYAEMVAEQPSITTRFNEVAIDVKSNGDRITGVITQDRDNQGKLGKKHSYTGKVIIDATYEADLAAFAGVPFRIGREARSKEEPHAGRIYTNYFRGVKGMLPDTILPESTGEADDRSQAFTYRITAKDYGRPDHPFRLKTPPPDYDPAKYRWNQNTKPIIPNGKFDLLGISYGGDLTGHGTRWVLADWEERSEIANIYRNHDLGWLYYIQTEGGSPHIGLPDDEFTDNNHFPYRLYVRQGRRIEGMYTLTESDIHKDLRGNGVRGPLHSDSVAIGVYLMDVHNVQNPTVRNEPPYGSGAAEGTLHMGDVTGPYQIPYGTMVPKTHQGLLFPVGISSTHVAMSTVRMEPVWSALGQAAGIAAALAIDNDLELGNVPVCDIQDELVRQGCVVFFYTDLPGDAIAFKAVQKLSLLGAVDGDEEYHFRPKELVTLGELARMAVKGFQFPLSITAAHFSDVPRSHPAFKYVETLYDYSTQSREPFFDYELQKGSKKALAHPDQKVTGARATKIISGLLQTKMPAWPEPEVTLTRGEAARLVYQSTKHGNPP